jgi:hypothetical protein
VQAAMPVTTQHLGISNNSLNATKIDQNDPPTKLIKLINGSAILAPMDKDNNKMLHSGQLTLQQVLTEKSILLKQTIC